MAELEQSLSGDSYSTSTIGEKRVWVAFDQSGTYRALLPGTNVRCMNKPLNEIFAEYLYKAIRDEDVRRLQKMTAQSTIVFRNLPNIDDSPEDNSIEEFRSDIQGSIVRAEQEAGLMKLSQNPNVGCTMTSSMPAEGGPWAWFGLGEIGRGAVHPDRQMILRRGKNSFVSKISELLIIKFGLDQQESERSEPEQMFFVEDDLNIACLVSRFLQIPVLVPIDWKQEAHYPLLPIPKILRDEYEEVYVGAGLLDLSQFLSEYLKGNIPENRFNAYRFQTTGGVELLRELPLDVFRSFPRSGNV